MFEQSFYDHSNRLQKKLRDEVERLPEEEIRSNSIDQIVARLAQKYQLDVPVVETDPNKFVWDVKKNEAVDSQSAVVSVPFTGDRELFAFNPHAHPLLNVPVSVKATTLEVSTQLNRKNPAPQIENVKTEVGRIAQCMKAMAQLARQHNERMPTLAKELVDARRARFEAKTHSSIN